MGTDIHIVIEQYYEPLKRWVGWCINPHGPASDRNYDLFDKLGCNRGRAVQAKGTPDDCSDYFRMKYLNGGYHSHSWHMMKDAAKLWATKYSADDKPSKDDIKRALSEFGLWFDDKIEDMRVLYCFDS